MNQANEIISLLEYSGNDIKIDFKTFKDNKVVLSDDERDVVMKSKATWHHGNQGQASPAVWKSVVKGETYYITNTHRAYNVTKSLKGTIDRYHKFIKGTA